MKHSTLFNHVLGDSAQSEPDETRDDHGIVKMADDWNEVWDQIQGHGQVSERRAEQNLRAARAARMSKNEAVHSKLARETTTDVVEPVGNGHAPCFS